MLCYSGKPTATTQYAIFAGDILTDNHARADVIHDACWQCEWLSEIAALDIRIEPTDISRRQEAVVPNPGTDERVDQSVVVG